LVISRQLADAVDGRDLRQTIDAPSVPRTIESRRPGASSALYQPSLLRREGMFGESPKRKVLCSCGVIAEVDLRIASTKMNLGKVLECRTCRNERISRERGELERHFSGEEENQEI